MTHTIASHAANRTTLTSRKFAKDAKTGTNAQYNDVRIPATDAFTANDVKPVIVGTTTAFAAYAIAAQRITTADTARVAANTMLSMSLFVASVIIARIDVTARKRI